MRPQLNGGTLADDDGLTMLTFEFREPVITRCDCCGGSTTTLTRFIYRDGDAYGVYYAAFSDRHDNKIISAIVSLGEWGTDEVPPSRIAVSVDLWNGPDSFGVQVTAEFTNRRTFFGVSTIIGGWFDPHQPER